MPNRFPNRPDDSLTQHKLDHLRPCTCIIDFPRINKEALRQIRPLLSAFVPSASLPDFCTAEAAGGGSFVDDHTGQWADVATGERGDDLISFIAYLLRLNRREAAKFLAGLLQISWQPLQ
jgi:putative DNA primase/helicase